MIPNSPTNRQPLAWQASLRDCFKSVDELCQYLQLQTDDLQVNADILRQFPLRVPRAYAARIHKGNPRDPLLLQVLPQAAEALTTAGYSLDPVGDLSSSRGGGVLHKYHGRALLITTGACAVHCRYCFRRAFPYSEHNARSDNWQAALDSIRDDPGIEEVILSGGDPLSLTDDRLAGLAEALDAIPHLQRLRIHTRQPVVLPERVDAHLLAWLGQGRLQRIMVLHCNHARELDDAVLEAIRLLKGRGVALFNQAVLLRGVNDDFNSLYDLCQALFSAGVIPYYLHQLDKIQGAAHFEVSDARARALYLQLQNSLAGYMLPRLVREIPGAGSKQPLL